MFGVPKKNTSEPCYIRFHEISLDREIYTLGMIITGTLKLNLGFSTRKSKVRIF